MNDDIRFINELPDSMKQLGEQFLHKIRQIHIGGLIYHPISNKYVEQPNIYTVKIQPRVRSLRITLYGNPDDFRNSKINLKNDMRGYSAFVISDINYLDSAISLITQAKSMKGV